MSIVASSKNYKTKWPLTLVEYAQVATNKIAKAILKNHSAHPHQPEALPGR
jgi:Mor family transcriptional regulator